MGPSWVPKPLCVSYFFRNTQMYDTLIAGVHMDFGFIHAPQIQCGVLWKILAMNKIEDFTSYYQSNKSTYETNLKRILDAFDELG